MKCYTGVGDNGETCVFGGKADKHDERIDAMGQIDELNASIAAAVSFSASDNIKAILQGVQNDLFGIGAELAVAEGSIKLGEKDVAEMEELIDKLNSRLPRQTQFIIPAGTQASVMINLARTVARRAERALVKLDRAEPINPQLLRYANRLSSLLHTLARAENNNQKVKEGSPVYHYVK